MRIDIATLFPEMCERVLGESILGRAQRAGHIEFCCHQIRDYTSSKQKRVDDSPYGGGMGMVMQAQPLGACCEAIYQQAGKRLHTILLSPRGPVFTQQKARELAAGEGFLLVCGHYEGVDERFIEAYVDEELSIGDYVVTGGELGALVVADAVARLCDGVLADPVCFQEESHYDGLLEYPHYSHPSLWEGRAVPEILLGGNHAKIAEWRHEQSLAKTKAVRPELYEAWMAAHPPVEKKKRRRRTPSKPPEEE